MNNIPNDIVFIITSREPYNEEGNSHMHYLEELIKQYKVIFIDPPKKWPLTKFGYTKHSKNLILFNYLNIFPYKLFPKLAGKLNDLITSFFLNRIVNKNVHLILWQFDPYYLELYPFIRISKKVYFPLDGYSKDPRDEIFAKRADLLVTVNSTFIDQYYHKFNPNIFLIPHGFSEFQKNPDYTKVKEIANLYQDFVILTGSLTFGVDYELLNEVAKSIFPHKLVLIGKQLTFNDLTETLFNNENVIYLGPKSYKELKNYISAAKCCIVSYDKDTGTARNPIKITDYIANYKIVVNTIPLKDLSILESKALFTTYDRDKYISTIKEAFNGNITINKTFYDQYITENSYEKLLSKILNKLAIN